jgi:hypothetical protein
MIEKFDEKAFEEEIKELSREVEKQGTPEAPKEAIRAVIGEKLYQGGSEKLPSGVSAPSAQAAPSTGPLPAYASDVPPEIRLKAEKLIEQVFHKGLMRSIKEVKKSDPLVMDLFHDAITERLYSEFKKRGILK